MQENSDTILSQHKKNRMVGFLFMLIPLLGAYIFGVVSAYTCSWDVETASEFPVSLLWSFRDALTCPYVAVTLPLAMGGLGLVLRPLSRWGALVCAVALVPVGYALAAAILQYHHALSSLVFGGSPHIIGGAFIAGFLAVFLGSRLLWSLGKSPFMTFCAILPPVFFLFFPCIIAMSSLI